MKSTPGWENCANVWGPLGKQRGKLQPREMNYEIGLQKIRDYLVEGFPKSENYVWKVGRWLCGRVPWLSQKGEDQQEGEGNDRSDLEQGENSVSSPEAKVS